MSAGMTSDVFIHAAWACTHGGACKHDPGRFYMPTRANTRCVMLARHAVFTRAASCEHVTRVNMIYRHVYTAGHVKTRHVFDIMQKCVNM